MGRYKFTGVLQRVQEDTHLICYVGGRLEDKNRLYVLSMNQFENNFIFHD